jgi:hypothetical protein
VDRNPPTSASDRAPWLRVDSPELLRTSLQRQPQALRDDHEPEGPRHQTPHRHSGLHGGEPRCPETPVEVAQTRPVRYLARAAGGPRSVSQQVRHPGAPLRCRHRRGMRPGQPRQRKPRPGVAITWAVPNGVRSRSRLAEAKKDVPHRPSDGVPNGVRSRPRLAEAKRDVPHRPSDGVFGCRYRRSYATEVAEDVRR